MANTYQFGNICYHAHKRELVHHGEVIALRRKVAALLELLLENRHRVIEREELLTSIWREGVMRENSLLQCVRELRQALGDNAQRPQFIKTYHLKGYQWIYTPTVIISTESPPSNESLTANIPIQSNSFKFPRFSGMINSLKMSRVVFVSFALVICLMALLFYWRAPRPMPPVATSPDTVTLVILPFSNHTGDASLQWVRMGLSDMVMSALAQSSRRQANQDYANGMQALNTKGAPLAKRYFEAALLNDPNFMWAKAQLAQTISQLGDWKSAKTQLQHLLQQQQVDGDPALKSFVQLSLGNILLAQLQFNQAKTLFHSVITLSDVTKDRYKKADALWRLSQVSEYRSQWEQQHNYAQQALALTQNAEDRRIQAESLYYLGSPSNSRLEFDANIDMHENRLRLERALRYYQQLSDIPGQAKTWLSMGQNYTFDFEQRIDFLDQAAQWYEKLNDQIQLANTLAYKGFLYIQYHQGDKAVIPLQASFQITQSIGAVHAE